MKTRILPRQRQSLLRDRGENATSIASLRALIGLSLARPDTGDEMLCCVCIAAESGYSLIEWQASALVQAMLDFCTTVSLGYLRFVWSPLE